MKNASKQREMKRGYFRELELALAREEVAKLRALVDALQGQIDALPELRPTPEISTTDSGEEWIDQTERLAGA